MATPWTVLVARLKPVLLLALTLKQGNLPFAFLCVRGPGDCGTLPDATTNIVLLGISSARVVICATLSTRSHVGCFDVR